MIIHTGESEPLYSRRTAARLAGISVDFLLRCEREQLVEPRRFADGQVGYSAADIRQLARIRRLRRSLGLDFSAVEVVLHLRRQIIETRALVVQMEREMERREREWQKEIEALRRQLAQEFNWY